MAQNVRINGVDYTGVPAVVLPKSAGGVARFCDTSDANAIAEDILSGKTAYVNGVKLTGTGSGSVEPYAVIYAHYKPGATCVCTNGVKTLTAEDTSGDYCFLLPSGGTWTVTATLDGVTSSKTVTISHQFQCVQVLLDKVWFIRDGVPMDGQSAWTRAWRNGATQRVIWDDHGVYFKCNANGYCRGALQSVNRINFGTAPNYSVLGCRFDAIESYNTGLRVGAVGYGDIKVYEEETDAINDRNQFFTANAYYNPASDAPVTTLTLDVSNVTGEHYIALYTGTLLIHALDLWLE